MAEGGTADEQLAALASVAGLLDRMGVEHWLFGGWAVDFWAGRVTRPHGDVDLVLWQDDRESVGVALEQDGWVPDVVDDAAIGAAFRRRGVLLELTFVVADQDGRVFLPFREEPGLWSAEPFGQNRRALGGVTCRVVSLAALSSDKAHPRDDPEDAAKDRLDREVLSQLPD